MTTAGKHIRSVPLISEVTSLKCLRFDFVYERIHFSSVERGLCSESRGDLLRRRAAFVQQAFHDAAICGVDSRHNEILRVLYQHQTIQEHCSLVGISGVFF